MHRPLTVALIKRPPTRGSIIRLAAFSRCDPAWVPVVRPTFDHASLLELAQRAVRLIS
jgi:hypothetical protein